MILMARDLRKYTSQTTTRLLVGGLLLLIIVGDGLILLIYGREAALTGLICLFVGLLPLVLVLGFLWGIEIFIKAADKD
jgi:hypothetical protein